MLRKCFLLIVLTGVVEPGLINAGSPDSSGKLSVAEIIDRNAQARGGLQAWRSVQTMSMAGKLDAGGTAKVQLPILLEMKRPRKTRVELVFKGETAVQVYDGTTGWKLRPYLNRRDVEPFTPEEIKAAALQTDLDGALMDYVAKGNTIDLLGITPVEGHNAYDLLITQKDGQSRHVWLDAETFLELKIEGKPRRLDGKYRPVSTYLRDYRSVNGLLIPYLLETAVEGVKQTEKILIEKVVVNPALQDSLFTKPQ
jgi:hypothetical protein